eukprot:Selendium_serpulae@DN5637_c0_g1_i18.p1
MSPVVTRRPKEIEMGAARGHHLHISNERNKIQAIVTMRRPCSADTMTKSKSTSSLEKETKPTSSLTASSLDRQDSSATTANDTTLEPQRQDPQQQQPVNGERRHPLQPSSSPNPRTDRNNGGQTADRQTACATRRRSTEGRSGADLRRCDTENAQPQNDTESTSSL